MRVAKTSVEVSWRNLTTSAKTTGTATQKIMIQYYHQGKAGWQVSVAQFQDLGTKVLNHPTAGSIIPRVIVHGRQWGEMVLDYGSGVFSPTPPGNRREIISNLLSKLFSSASLAERPNKWSSLVNTQNVGQIPFATPGKIWIVDDKQGVPQVHLVAPGKPLQPVKLPAKK